MQPRPGVLRWAKSRYEFKIGVNAINKNMRVWWDRSKPQSRTSVSISPTER